MKKQTQIGAFGLIENDGKILLTKHNNGPYKGLLDLPGGDFIHGETARQCVARQIEKESEIDISELKLLDVLTDRVSWNNNDTMEDLHMICILFNINAKIQKLKDTSLNWFDINDINLNNLTPVAIKAIGDFKKC